MRRQVLSTAVAVLGALSVAPLAASAAPSRVKTPTPVVVTCANKTAVRPASFVLACADDYAYLEKTTWSSWSRAGAAGKGTFYLNSCNPTCVASRVQPYAATLTLSGARQTKVGLKFTEMVVTFKVGHTTKRYPQALLT